MPTFDPRRLNEFAGERIEEFHNARFERLQKVKLNTILRRKNPYLFRAKDMQSASQMVHSLLDAYLSSSEEELFGRNFLESLVIRVSSENDGGRKSSAEGIDLEFDRQTPAFWCPSSLAQTGGITHRSNAWPKTSEPLYVSCNREIPRRISSQCWASATAGQKPPTSPTTSSTKARGFGTFCQATRTSIPASLSQSVIWPVNITKASEKDALPSKRSSLRNSRKIFVTPTALSTGAVF